MKKIIALSAILITFGLLLITFVLFYAFVDDNIGGFGMMITFFIMIFIIARLVIESSDENA